MKLEEFFEFLVESTDPFNNIELFRESLNTLGYTELSECEKWDVVVGGKYYIVRNDCSIIICNVGNNPTKFNIVASHNDSPSFKLKQSFDMVSCNYNRLDTEIYGGPILTTWFDRPLGICGRVFVKSSEGVESIIVNIPGACVIPNLAIHLSRPNTADINPANDTLPVCGLNSGEKLFDLIKRELNLGENDLIISHDLFLYNDEEPRVVGLDSSLICAPRLDDLECVYASYESLVNSVNDDSINLCCVFNNEEVGSGSSNAAESTFLLDTMNHLIELLGMDKYTSFAKSFLVSADNAHAVHPANPGKTDPLNKVELNKGIAIKSSASLSYTTDGASRAEFVSLLIDNNVKYQEFANASNVRGGSTLGHILIDKVSIPSVDIGLGQLAMHSAYETAGVKDLEELVLALNAFYKR